MKFNYNHFFSLLPLLLMTGCQEPAGPTKKDMLAGNWQAIELTEEERQLQVNLDEIGFRFSGDNSYLFNSTLNYREAGRFAIRNNYLITTDTTRAESEEKTVEIINLVPDTLQLRMMENDKERILVLKRVQ